jgi:hypothetical protein
VGNQRPPFNASNQEGIQWLQKGDDKLECDKWLGFKMISEWILYGGDCVENDSGDPRVENECI